MNIERSILIAFLGNFLINTVATALVSLIPASASGGMLTPQYVSFVVLSAVVVAILAWWYTRKAARGWKVGLMFGGIGFLVAIVTAFISGISGVLTQTGSLAQVWGVLPNFWPFLWNVSTLILLGYWVIPAVLVGWLTGRKAAPMMAMPPRPMV
jgi:hypothetical protein